MAAAAAAWLRSANAPQSKKLSVLLHRHVRAYIPSLRNEITTTMGMLRTQLEQYGGEDAVRAEIEHDQGAVLLTLLSEYSDEFVAVLNGRHQPPVDEDEEMELLGGARINWIFHEMFQVLSGKVVAAG
jgi:hypothetical protein